MPPAPPPPRFLFVQVNKRCNLRCQHCDFWMLDDADKPNYLPWARKRQILAEFAQLSPGGAVVICGGESMLDIDDYFSITTTCRTLGLKSLSVVNGTRIRDARMADRMIVDGPDEVTVSLNSHREALHDETRGVKGAFKKAVGALRLLLDARKRHPDRASKIYAMGLIFDQNYRELDAFYDFVLNDIGADKLKLNFIQPSFGHGGEDKFFAAHYDVDPDEVARQIAHCNEKYGLNLNPVWAAQVRMYFRSLRASKNIAKGWGDETGTQDHICNTYERNIMLDHYGMARLCFSTRFPGKRLVLPGDLTRFWNGADPIRARMRSCNAYCGISHSVRREHSTLRPAPDALPDIGIAAKSAVFEAAQAFERAR
ncbi:MAG: radical SAM protein [Alphaproteobacteria bacterium]|nr:radical SAM protein [Alphaproteobacteria bacterium]